MGSTDFTPPPPFPPEMSCFCCKKEIKILNEKFRKIKNSKNFEIFRKRNTRIYSCLFVISRLRSTLIFSMARHWKSMAIVWLLTMTMSMPITGKPDQTRRWPALSSMNLTKQPLRSRPCPPSSQDT
jgi:hypothetical protein